MFNLFRIRRFAGEEKWIYLIFLYSLLGIFSAIIPFCLLMSLFVIFFIFIFFYNINFTFLYMVFILLLQPTIAFNTEIFGLPNIIKNIVGGADEVVWFFFLIVVLLRNFNYEKWEVSITNLELPALLFIFVGISSILVNQTYILWSMVAILLALKGVFIYWISKNLKYTTNDIITFYKYLLNFLVITFIIGLLQYTGVKIPFIPQHSRFGVNIATSIFGHHYVFGFVMAFGFSLSTGIYLSTRNKKWLIFSLMFLTGIILSSIRKSLLGILFGLLFVFLNYRRLKIDKRDIYAGLIVSIALFGVFSNRFTNILENTRSEYVYHLDIAPRFLLYYGAYKILQKKPFLGEGPGRYGSYISVITKSDVYGEYGVIISDDFKTDTYWPYILGEYGIFGFIVIVAILIILFKHLWKLSQVDFDNKFLKGISIGYLSLYIEYLFESLLLPCYHLSLPTFLLFGGIGILESLSHQEKYSLSLADQN